MGVEPRALQLHGLALGNGLSARFGAWVRRPILVFALAEITVALSGIALVALLPHLSEALSPLLGPVAEREWILNLLRLSM